MKKVIRLVFTLVYLTSFVDAQSIWQTQVSHIPSNEMVLVFSPVNDNVCWASTVDTSNGRPSGYIRTTDGGNTWAYARIPGATDGIIGQVAALDADTAYAAVWVWNPSNTAGVYKTTDGGATWTKQNVYGPTTTRYGPGSIHFFDSRNGVAEGTWIPETYTTSDGGLHWTLATVPSVYSGEVCQSEIVYSGNWAWFVSTGERVFRSSDRGHTWSASALESQYSNYFPSIDFQDSSTGLLTQKRQEELTPHLYRRTTDGGATWSLLSNPILDNISPTGIRHIPGTKATYLVGGGMNAGQKGLAITFDSGENWKLLDSSGALFLGFASENVGWCSPRQHNNGVCKYVGPRLVTSVQSRTSAPTSFFLSQNYPNPFNPKTGIRFQVSGVREEGSGGLGLGASNTKLVVYDLLGREVAVLVNEKKAPGSYEVTFDAEGLSSGVYFYRLEAGSFVQIKKMVLLK
jgi:photosystem II stability/assembly factor-like uncharacterized protein